MLNKKTRVILFLVVFLSVQIVTHFGFAHIIPGSIFLFSGYESHLEHDYFTTVILLMLNNFSIGFCISAIIINLGPKHPYTRSVLRIFCISLALGTMFYFIILIPDLNTKEQIYNFTEVVWSLSNIAIGISAATIRLRYNSAYDNENEW